MSKLILDLCGGTGSWSKPYKDAGYDVRVITLPDFDITNTTVAPDRITFRNKRCTEVFHVHPSEVHGILAAPPCTMFSLARTTAKDPRDFEGAMKIVRACLNIIWTVRQHKNSQLKFWAMENPTGFLRQFLGKPAMMFYQWEFGGQFYKRTDIWGYFNEPKRTNKVRPEYSAAGAMKTWTNPKIPPEFKHLSIPAARAAIRAITPEGFAKAFFKANK